MTMSDEQIQTIAGAPLAAPEPTVNDRNTKSEAACRGALLDRLRFLCSADRDKANFFVDREILRAAQAIAALSGAR